MISEKKIKKKKTVTLRGLRPVQKSSRKKIRERRDCPGAVRLEAV